MGVNSIPDTGGGKQPYRQVFYSSGTWTRPAGVNTATVTCVGGGGGAFTATTPQAGGGGGVIYDTVDVTGATSYTITVGAGGTSSGTKASATDGGTSSFGSLLYAYGGQGAGQTFTVAGTPCSVARSGHWEDTTSNANGIASGWWQPYGNRTNTLANQWIGASTPGKQGRPQQIAFNGTNLYVSTANTNNVVFTSSNGFTWTSNATTTGTLPHVGWNGTYFVAVPTQGVAGTTAYYSTNGTAWTTAALPSSQTWFGAITTTALSVAWNTTNTSAAYSTNGTTWTAVTLPAIPQTMSVANGRIYMIGSATGATYYTTNGSTWTTAGTTATTQNYVTYNAGTYLAYSSTNTTTAFYTSADGVAWTAQSWTTATPAAGPVATAANWYSPVVIGGRWFVWVTSAATATSATKLPVLYSSTNGTTWTYVRAWQDGVNNTTAGLMSPFFGADVFSAGTNRYLVNFAISQDNSASWHLETVLMSEYLVPGNIGAYSSAFSNTAPYTQYGYGAAGAGSSVSKIASAPSGGATAYNGAWGPGDGKILAGVERGKGGRGYTSLIDPAGFAAGYALNTDNGEGAPAFAGNINGGAGLVIVEWWA